MEELISLLKRIREKLEKYGEWLETAGLEMPNSFNMIFNATTLILEVLHYYYQIWGIPRTLPSDEIERLKKENAERVIEITKWAFVHTLSIIEYSTKEIIKKMSDEKLSSYPAIRKVKDKLQAGKKVYLSTIIKEFKEGQLISDEEYDVWRGLIETRNIIVHNNAIAEETKSFKMFNEFRISFVKGKMLKDKLDFFIKLLDVAIDQHHQWIRSVINLRFTEKS